MNVRKTCNLSVSRRWRRKVSLLNKIYKSKFVFPKSNVVFFSEQLSIGKTSNCYKNVCNRVGFSFAKALLEIWWKQKDQNLKESDSVIVTSLKNLLPSKFSWSIISEIFVDRIFTNRKYAIRLDLNLFRKFPKFNFPQKTKIFPGKRRKASVCNVSILFFLYWAFFIFPQCFSIRWIKRSLA